MKKLFTLFVGINDYQNRFNTLRGCIHDIDNLENVVQDHFANVFDHKHLRLIDKDATYKNIVEGFQNHLRQAGPEDTVWFHYSGHGTEEACASEFLTLEPNGKDQNLICFDTWDGYAPYLADKELAVLIHQVATQTVDGSPKESPHIVISLDSCHSGSGTRDVGEKLILPRSAEPQGINRNLDSYINGYYAAQKDNLSVPSSRHVLLAACESIQFAGDTSGGGLFTEGLVEAIRSCKGEINYADLFMLTRSTVGAKNINQSPQFQTIDNFNPYTKFLEGSAFGTPDRYEIVKDRGDWYVKCGAVHGLPTNNSNPLEIEVQNPKEAYKTIGKGTIKSVGAQRSKIDLDLNSGLTSFFKNVLSSKDSYVAVFNHFPAPPVYVKLSGDEEKLNAIEQKWSTAKNIKLANELEEAQIEVTATKDLYTIIDHDISQEAFTLETKLPQSEETILNALETIAKWKRMKKLRNQQEKSKLIQLASFELDVVNKNKEIETFTDPTARIFASQEDSYDVSRQGGADLAQILRPYVRINNTKQDLYFYLFQLENDYSIVCHEDEVIFRAAEHSSQTEVRLPLWTNQMRGWGLMPDQQTVNTQFKLLVTTEHLDYQQLTQAGLSASRSTTRLIEEDRISDDWWMIDMDLTMTRQEGEINAKEKVVLGNGSIIIEPHKSFTGRVGIADASGGSRSAKAKAPFSLSSQDGFERINFSQTRNATPQDLLEIEGIHPTVVKDLEEHPLRIKIDTKLSEDETMLPIAFDGEFYHLVGDSSIEDGQTVVNIRSIPDGEQTTKRGIFKSLKLAFYKIGLKKTEGLNQLRRVEISADGDINYTISGMGSKIVSAKKTLLVVHGLMGDTSSILKDLNELEPKLLSSFDLILTFDYENLSQSIPDTATALSEALSASGLSKNKANELTVLAHGSGGLVARQYIETLGGKDMVNHLILVGTPNNGTNTAQLDTFRKYSVSALELGFNFVPQLVPYSGIVLKGLRKLGSFVVDKVTDKLGEDLGSQVGAKIDEKLGDDFNEKVKGGMAELTASLRDMLPTANFINELNQSDDPQIPYTVISGDAIKYAQTVPGLAGFLERTKSTLGRGVHGKNHDLFSSKASIENVDTWKNRKPAPTIISDVASHHYNYFDLNAKVWGQILNNESDRIETSQIASLQTDNSQIESSQLASSQIDNSIGVLKTSVAPTLVPIEDNSVPKPTEVPISSLATKLEATSAPTKVAHEEAYKEAAESKGDSANLGQKIDQLTEMVATLTVKVEDLEKRLSNGKITF